MAKFIVTINNKGGVGKTSVATSLATETGKLGGKVLVVDLDPQGDLSKMFQRKEAERSAIDLFMLRGAEVTKENVRECIIATDYENVDIIPNRDEFSFTINEIFLDTTRAQQYILKKALTCIEDEYEYIIMDTPGFYNIANTNALALATDVLIPVNDDGFSFDSLTRLMNIIKEVRDEFNPGMKNIKIFRNMVDERTSLARSMKDKYQESLEENYVEASIRQNIQQKESNTLFVPLTEYDSSGKATTDYRVLINELDFLEAAEAEKLKFLLQEQVGSLEEQNKKDMKLLKQAEKTGSQAEEKRLNANIKRRSKEIERITKSFSEQKMA